jgi:hypothetical protein
MKHPMNTKLLCQACYPDQEEKIEQLFTQGEIPDFATVDAVKGGNNYPKLQSATGEKSEKEVILAILLPNQEQLKKLKKNKGWVKEYQLFSQSTIGLKAKWEDFGHHTGRIVAVFTLQRVCLRSSDHLA